MRQGGVLTSFFIFQEKYDPLETVRNKVQRAKDLKQEEQMIISYVFGWVI